MTRLTKEQSLICATAGSLFRSRGAYSVESSILLCASIPVAEAPPEAVRFAEEFRTEFLPFPNEGVTIPLYPSPRLRALRDEVEMGSDVAPMIA